MAHSPASHLPSTLQMLEAVASSNNHNRDLSFLCSGISLSYHQSILTFYSPFLTNMLGALACCKCEKAQCGRKEELVIVLDKVEVGTVQGLMEYLYKGECMVKDKSGVKEMQELVNMLGIKLKLEIKQSNIEKEIGRVESNLEETVSNLLIVEETKLVDEQRQIAEDILKFAETFCVSDEDRKCSKCDEWLSKENFMEHFKIHRETIQTSLQAVPQQGKLPSPIEDKKKRGPKPGGRSKKDSVSREVIDDTSNDNNKISLNVPIDDKQVANGTTFPELKSKGRKRKKSEIAASEEEFADEYTCFNPTFKIKAGVKKVGKIAKQPSLVVPVPEIKLTFNLTDLGIAQETIKLQDLSVGPNVDKVLMNSSVKKVEDVTKKKRKSKSKVMKSEYDRPSSRSGKESKDSVNGTSITTSPTISIPSSSSCTSFPAFLRQVCSQADTVLPPGLDREHEEVGRRVVHRLAGQRIQEGVDRQVTRDDVMKEMIDGIDDDENLNNVSSDGSEAPLVMDLSELDL